MQRKMSELKEKWFNEGIAQPLRIRCGINTGMVNVAVSDQRPEKILRLSGRM